MKIILLMLFIPLALLLVMLILPLRVTLNLDVEKGRITINWLFFKNFELAKVLKKIAEVEKKPKSEFSSTIGKEIAKTIIVRDLSIVYVTSDGDYAKLALLNGAVAAFLPLIRIMLSNNLSNFYYRGEVGKTSNILIKSKLYISLIRILSVMFKVKRRLRYERKHGRIS